MTTKNRFDDLNRERQISASLYSKKRVELMFYALILGEANARKLWLGL